MTGDFEVQYRRVWEAVSSPLGDAPVRYGLVWASMIYACVGNPSLMAGRLAEVASREEGRRLIEESGCGYERRMVLEVGVEGPPDLKEAGLFVPTPMIGGTCPDCDGRLQHVRWDEDEEFPERERALGEPYAWGVPRPTRARRLARRGYGGADLVEPSGSGGS